MRSIAIWVILLADELSENNELAPVERKVRDVDRDERDENDEVLRADAWELPVCGRLAGNLNLATFVPMFCLWKRLAGMSS